MKKLRARSAILKKPKFGRLRGLVSLLGLLLVTNFIYAQEYESIVDTTKMWVVFYNSSIDPPGIGETYAYKIKEKVIEDTITWYKTWQSRDSLYSNWEQVGYVCEKDKKVYYKDSYNSEHILLYDFNLQTDDTLFTIEEICTITVTDTDTIEFAGKYRFLQELYDYDNLPEPVYHIEGVGSKSGVFEPKNYCMVGVSRTLVCYYKNDELLYMNNGFSSCYINTTSINENNFVQINAYQTKNNTIQVDGLPTNGNNRYCIINMFGQTMLTGYINADGRIQYNNLNTGIYLLSIQTSNLTSRTIKLFI
ncbi:MAG: T9SS type A sorting domain-containing protein, partial [Bacteroidales bacterium]|nr:T9SS type A sorting domain-containing protein [Bacteroidales bacterium]